MGERVLGFSPSQISIEVEKCGYVFKGELFEKHKISNLAKTAPYLLATVPRVVSSLFNYVNYEAGVGTEVYVSEVDSIYKLCARFSRVIGLNDVSKAFSQKLGFSVDNATIEMQKFSVRTDQKGNRLFGVQVLVTVKDDEEGSVYDIYDTDTYMSVLCEVLRAMLLVTNGGYAYAGRLTSVRAGFIRNGKPYKLPEIHPFGNGSYLHYTGLKGQANLLDLVRLFFRHAKDVSVLRTGESIGHIYATNRNIVCVDDAIHTSFDPASGTNAESYASAPSWLEDDGTGGVATTRHEAKDVDPTGGAISVATNIPLKGRNSHASFANVLKLPERRTYLAETEDLIPIEGVDSTIRVGLVGGLKGYLRFDYEVSDEC